MWDRLAAAALIHQAVDYFGALPHQGVLRLGSADALPNMVLYCCVNIELETCCG